MNFPSYLLQSLALSTQSIQRDLTGEHVSHEGIMVLIMNLHKSKKIPKPRNLKGGDQDTEGSIPEKGYNSDTQDEAEGGRASPKRGSGGSNKK